MDISCFSWFHSKNVWIYPPTFFGAKNHSEIKSGYIQFLAKTLFEKVGLSTHFRVIFDVWMIHFFFKIFKVEYIFGPLEYIFGPFEYIFGAQNTEFAVSNTFLGPKIPKLFHFFEVVSFFEKNRTFIMAFGTFFLAFGT